MQPGSRTLRTAAILTAAAVVWHAAAELAWPARLLTTFLLAILPVLTLAQLALVEEVPDELPRPTIYVSSAAAIWLLAALTAAAAGTGGFGPARLGLLPLAPAPLATWSIAATGAGLGLMAAGRALGIRESRLLVHLLPRTGGEKIAFIGLSLSAGIGEEFVFRAFLIPALATASGSLVLATVLSSGVFGLVHSYQRVAGVVRATLLGALLAIPFLWSGSILPSMIAHAALDIIGGLWLGKWLLRQ